MPASPPTSDGPWVSVLTAAFDRREFLLTAVRSVLRSTLPRARYELVVVKNFVDPEIDRFLAAAGVRVLNEGPAPIGAWMARGLAVARAPIVCLLNDDDEFEPEKLATVVERFRSVPGLRYYHDRRTLIGPDGAPRAPAGRWERPQASPFAIATDRDRRAEVGRVHRCRGLFHDSCISFDRSVLEPHRDDLARVEVSEDVFTYFCALAQAGTLYFDSRRLTRFRVHPRSKYRAEKTGPGERRIEAKRAALIASIERIARGTAAEPAARLFRVVTIHQAFLEGEGTARPRAAEYWGLLVGVMRYRVPSHAVLWGFSALKVVAPRATTAFFARFWGFLDDSVT